MDHPALNALLVAVSVSTVARVADCAASPATLSVEVNVCPGSLLAADEMQRSVSSELEADGVVRVIAEDANQSGGGKLSASIGCDPALTTLIVLRASGSGREVRRSLVLADADPSARSRVLALAASEIVRSDWPELSEGAASAAYPDAANDPEKKPPSVDAAAGTPPTAPPVRVALPANAAQAQEPTAPGPAQSRAGSGVRVPRGALSANARLRWFVDYASVALGGDAGGDFGALRLRAELLVSSKEDALGSASLGSGALCVGYRMFESKLGPLSIAGYPVLSAGLTWMRGTSPHTEVRVEPATGLYADARLLAEARLTQSTLSPTFAAEIGRATGFVARSADRVLGATGGFFIGASAGGRY
jgi:hypothetical protein